MEFPYGNKKFVEAIFLEVSKLSTRNLLGYHLLDKWPKKFQEGGLNLDFIDYS